MIKTLAEQYAEIQKQIEELTLKQQQIENQMKASRLANAEQIFDGMLDSICELAKLGYTVEVEIEGEDWHEIGKSITDIALTRVDPIEAANIIKEYQE